MRAARHQSCQKAASWQNKTHPDSHKLGCLGCICIYVQVLSEGLQALLMVLKDSFEEKILTHYAANCNLQSLEWI